MRAIRHDSARRQMWTGALLSLATLLLVGSPGCHYRMAIPPSSPAGADTLANGLPRALLPELAAWLAHWREGVPAFTPDSLVPGAISPLAFQVAAAGTDLHYVEGVRERAGILVLSPDSVHAVDFDRYIEVDPVRGWLFRDVDSSPMLVDFVADTLWTVDVCGTSCSYDGAAWIDADRFALTGLTQSRPDGEGPLQAFLDVYDLRARTGRRWLGTPVEDAAWRRFSSATAADLGRRVQRALVPAGAARGTRQR